MEKMSCAFTDPSHAERHARGSLNTHELEIFELHFFGCPSCLEAVTRARGDFEPGRPPPTFATRVRDAVSRLFRGHRHI